MPLPPKDDPRRPLHIAALLMRLIGGFTVGIAIVHIVTIAILFPPRPLSFNYVASHVAPLCYGIIGLAYLAMAAGLVRRKFWACLASVILVAGTLSGTLVILILLLNEAFILHPHAPLPTYLAVFVMAITSVALWRLMRHLLGCFDAIKHPPRGRGFDPIMNPVPPRDANAAPAQR